MPAESSRNDQPNVVLINCDDLGFGDLGCYGSELHKTLAIDRLAAEGMRLTSFYAASPVCSPSRAALLTGCYPPRIGFGDFDGAPVLFPGHPMGLNPSEVTIAKLLSEAGYATSLVGKWHCGDQPEFLPTEHGFDEYFGLPYSNDMGRQAWYADLPPYTEFLESLGVHLPTEEMPPLPLLDGAEVLEEQPRQEDLTRRYVDRCVQFMRENSESPFFLYLSHMYVHVPLYVEDRFLEESENGSYGAAVACIDWSTEVILRELEELGLADNTIVIFTSDNGSRVQGGGGSNHPLRAHKGTTWEGGQRVPCIVRYPEHVPAGATSDAVCSAMDFYPTLAKWCGTELPTDRTIDGHDVSPLLMGQTEPGNESEPFFYYLGNTLEAVRLGKWKLHVSRGGEAIAELYDLNLDVGETTQVGDQHREVVLELESHAQIARASLGDQRLGLVGGDVRPSGRVLSGQTLTIYDEDHPYVVAEYDLLDRG